VDILWEYDGPPIPWLSGMARVGKDYWALNSMSGTVHRLGESRTGMDTITLPEVEAPVLLGPGPGGVAIYDAGKRRVVVFRDQRIVRRVDMPRTVFFPKDILALADGTVVVAAGLEGSNESIHVIAPDGSGTRGILRLPSMRQPLLARMIAGGVLEAYGDMVWFAQASSHLIGRVDVRAGAFHQLVADTSVLSPIGDGFIGKDAAGRDRNRWFFPQARGIGLLPGGRVLHVIRLQEEGASIFEVYGGDGLLIARRRMERAFDVWQDLGDGTFLASYFADGPRSIPVRIRVTVVES
jgi:hypothetical protein